MSGKLLLAMFHSKGVHAYQLPPLIERFGSLDNCLNFSQQELIAQGVPKRLAASLVQPNWQAADVAYRWEQSHPANHLLLITDASYPDKLKAIYQPPPVLFLRGDPQLLQRHAIGIVGSRHPSPTGVDIAMQFAKELSDNGLCIISGLAQGIDAAAHTAALKAEAATIAVIGTGLHHTYPTKNKALAERIAKVGLIASEFPLDTPPKACNFPQRNRIISGLSLGTLVVEAALKSGSLITARLAMEQGRDVFAIPGSIYNPLSKGCHSLLQQGAKLTQSVDDILIEYSHLLDKNTTKTVETTHKRLDIDARSLVRFVGYELTPVDLLLKRTGLSHQALASELLALELLGQIKALPGGYVRLYAKEG